jgi:hypothetical protein
MNKLTNTNILLIIIMLYLIFSMCKSNNTYESFADQVNYTESVVGSFPNLTDIVSDESCNEPKLLGSVIIPDDFTALKDIQLSMNLQQLRKKDNGSFTFGFSSAIPAYPYEFSLTDGTNNTILYSFDINSNIPSSSTSEIKTFDWIIPSNLDLVPGQSYNLVVRICSIEGNPMVIKLRLRSISLTMRYFTTEHLNNLSLCVGPKCANYNEWGKMINEANKPESNTICIGDTCVNHNQWRKMINEANKPESNTICIGDTCINENQLAKLINTSNRTTALPHEHDDDDSGIMSKCLIL